MKRKLFRRMGSARRSSADFRGQYPTRLPLLSIVVVTLLAGGCGQDEPQDLIDSTSDTPAAHVSDDGQQPTPNLPAKPEGESHVLVDQVIDLLDVLTSTDGQESSSNGAASATQNTKGDVHAAAPRNHLQQYCSACHGIAEPEGDFDLAILGAQPNEITLPAWIDVLDLVRAEEMPPEDERSQQRLNAKS